jgi:hypothetical protein
MNVTLKLSRFVFTSLFVILTIKQVNAQTDSIYGLQAQVINDTLKATFYSTYNSSNFLELDISVVNPMTNQYYVKYTAQKGTGNTLTSNSGNYTFVSQGNGIQKFTIAVKMDPTILNNNLQISFFTWGSNYKSRKLNFAYSNP